MRGEKGDIFIARVQNPEMWDGRAVRLSLRELPPRRFGFLMQDDQWQAIDLLEDEPAMPMVIQHACAPGDQVAPDVAFHRRSKTAT